MRLPFVSVTLVALLALCASASAGDRGATPLRDAALKAKDVFVPRELRVRNSQSNCVWAAAESCFWGAAGLESCKGLTERAIKSGWRGAGMGNVLKYLDAVKVPYEVTYSKDYSLLHRAVAAGTGAYFEVDGHALFLCGIDGDGTRVIDSNGNGEVQSWSLPVFARAWNGSACFPKLFRRRPNPSPRPSAPHPPVNPDRPTEPETPEKILPPSVDATKLEKRLDGLADSLKENKLTQTQLLELIRQVQQEMEELRKRQPKDGPPGKDGRDGKDAEHVATKIEFRKVPKER
jgi:hypothetical protein